MFVWVSAILEYWKLFMWVAEMLECVRVDALFEMPLERIQIESQRNSSEVNVKPSPEHHKPHQEA